MEGHRRKLWYSVVSYYSDVIRGEILNVGMIVSIPEAGEISSIFLSDINSKLKSIITNKHDKDIYKTGLSYINYLLESINNNDLSFSVNLYSKDFIPTFKTLDLPKGFLIGEPKYANVSNIPLFLDSVKNIYIGETFLNEEFGSNSMLVKKKATSIISSRERLSKVIKNNLRIKPIPNLSKSYTIDFGYVLDDKVSLIHTAPDKITTAYDWLERMNFISDNFNDTDKITLLYDNMSESNEDGTLTHMLDYLKDKDNRITTMNIFSEEGLLTFQNDLNHIERFAGTIEDLEKVIA